MTFTYQRWKKQQSEQRILDSLSDRDRSFSNLLKLTDLSKSVLSERLSSLTKQGKIELVPETKTKRFLYHLIDESLDDVEKSLVLFHVLSNYAVGFLEKFAKDSSLSDKEYASRLTEGVMILFNFRMLEHTIAPKPVQEEWLKTTLGLEFVRKIPKLFPKNRVVLPYMLDGMSPKEQAIYESKDAEEAANQLLEHLNTLVEKLPRKQIDTV